MPVEFDEDEAYVTEPAPWHLVEVAPKENTGVVTLGVEMAVCVAAGVPQPAARAVIIELPTHPATKLTVPVVELIVLPADILGPSKV